MLSQSLGRNSWDYKAVMQQSDGSGKKQIIVITKKKNNGWSTFALLGINHNGNMFMF